MTTDPARRARLLLLIAGMTAFILTGALQGVMGPAIPLFEARFAIDTATASWVLSCLGLGGFASLVILYFAGHRVTPRMGLSLMAAGAAGLALAPGFLPAVAAALVFGMGFGSVAAMFNQRVLLAFGARGTAMLSLLNAAFSIGSISAPLAFLASGNRPEVIFTVVAGFAALTLLIAAPGNRPARNAAAPTPSQPFRFHLPILAFGMIGIGIEVSLAGLGPSGLIRAGLPADEASRLLSAHFLALLAGRLVLTAVGERLGGFAIYTGAILATALCGLLAILVATGPFFVAMGFFAGMFFPGYYVTATAKMGDDPRVSPVILATAQVGVVVVPLVVARIMPLMGEMGYFWLLTVTAGLVSLLALASYRRMSA